MEDDVTASRNMKSKKMWSAIHWGDKLDCNYNMSSSQFWLMVTCPDQVFRTGLPVFPSTGTPGQDSLPPCQWINYTSYSKQDEAKEIIQKCTNTIRLFFVSIQRTEEQKTWHTLSLKVKLCLFQIVVCEKNKLSPY